MVYVYWSWRGLASPSTSLQLTARKDVDGQPAPAMTVRVALQGQSKHLFPDEPSGQGTFRKTGNRACISNRPTASDQTNLPFGEAAPSPASGYLKPQLLKGGG